MKNKLRLIVDTNIFINGTFFPKAHIHCKDILDLIKTNNYDLAFSQETIGELMYVVKNFLKFDRTLNYKDKLKVLCDISTLFYESISVNTENTIAEKCDDSHDDMFIKCFVESDADYIITQDFNAGMHKVKNINVLSSKEFIRKEKSEIAFD